MSDPEWDRLQRLFLDALDRDPAERADWVRDQAPDEETAGRLDPALQSVLAQEAHRLASGTEAVLKQLLTLLVLQTLRAYLAERTPSELRALLSPDVARAVSYVHDHLDEKILIADLCAEPAYPRRSSGSASVRLSGCHRSRMCAACGCFGLGSS